MKLIFDLDQTLVNSRILKPLRQKRDWQSVYSLIPQCTLYPGISEVFDYIRINKIPVCIVSTAPRPYIERMIRHFNIPCNAIVGYYDAKPIKPHPAPMLKALELLGADASEAISFGDRQIDIESSNRAGIRSVACLWDSDEH
jgi:phosphoglycolate phosphatase-like HAD superfamily hydrolase